VRIDLGNLEAYARGCAILGTGGGGDTTTAVLASRHAIQTHGPVDVISLDDLPDDALVLPVSGWGAPTVGIEKFGSGEEAPALREAAERWFGRPIAALMVGEIGGGNGVQPVGWAADLDLPLVDADAMGRAFPEGDMASMYVMGVPAAPAFFADERGTIVTAVPTDAVWLERIARHLVMAFGGIVTGADHVMEARVARGATVRDTVPLALSIGQALEADRVDGIIRATGGRTLLTGTIVDVERRTTGGFARGIVTLDGTGGDTGRVVRVHVQNENLLATEGTTTLASVPDLITIVDEATGDAVATERIRYGMRVVVLAMPCAPVWRTPRGLEVAGPERFGYPGPFVPIERAGP
jgi:hypothetical protein